MFKIILFCVLVAMACSVNAQFNQLFDPASMFGNSDGTGGFFNMFRMAHQLTPQSIEKLGPGSSGAYSSSSTTIDKNGKVERSGTVITNNDGEITKKTF